jgi:hypothetical protein
MKLPTLLGAVLVTAALSPLTLASPAQAAGADCSADLTVAGYIYLTDGSFATWDITQDGYVDDGSLGGRSDAYDSFPYFAIDDGTNGREDYTNPGTTCTYEANGRQVALPVMTTTGGLELSRKVFVPDTGPGFARFYDQVHNPGTSPVTITVFTSDGNSGSLGSDNSTVIDDSSAGPGVTFVGNTLDTAVSWLTTSDGPNTPSSDPQLAHNLDATSGTGVRDRVDSIVEEGGNQDSLTFAYQNVTVPAGGTVAYLSFEAMRSSSALAGDAARYVDGQPAAIYSGLSISDAALVQNWNATDFDKDGVLNASDNCPMTSNANQSDIDHDGIGDACDSDADGDGLANDVETAIHTNPLSADTDADGVKDNADLCPSVSAPTANGCPPSARRTSTTKLKVHESKTGPVVLKAKAKVRSTSTALPNDCTHGSAAVIVKVAKKVVATKIVHLKATCVFKTKLTLDMPRKKVHDVKVTGWFLGSDGLLPSKDKVKLS